MQAFSMVLSIQRILKRLNLFFPSTNENAAKWGNVAPPTPITPPRFQELAVAAQARAQARALAGHFFAEFGMYHSETEFNR